MILISMTIDIFIIIIIILLTIMIALGEEDEGVDDLDDLFGEWQDTRLTLMRTC